MYYQRISGLRISHIAFRSGKDVGMDGGLYFHIIPPLLAYLLACLPYILEHF